MPDITGPPVTLDGAALQGAKITAINNDTGEVLGTTTTDASGNWTITVGGGQTVHVLAEYDDGAGTRYQEHSKPFIVVESTGPLGNPVSWWPHNEGSGTVLGDSIGTLDGDIIGSTWQTGAGYEDIYLAHDGVDDYVSLGTWTMPNTNGAFSVVMWVRFDDPLGPSQPLFGSNTSSVRFHKSGSGDNVYARYHNANTVEIIPAAGLTAGWHMCAITRAEDGTGRGYYDNQGLQGTGTWAETLGSVEHRLASTTGWTETHNGATDYVALYDYQLTAQQILDIYNDTSANYP